MRVYRFLSTIKVQSLSNKVVEIAVIATVLIVFLVAIQLVYGQTAGSLKELESQVKNETGYRSELENYVTSHNLTLVGPSDSLALNPITFDSSDLEAVVKNHISMCQQSANETITYETTLPLVGHLITTPLMGTC